MLSRFTISMILMVMMLFITSANTQEEVPEEYNPGCTYKCDYGGNCGRNPGETRDRCFCFDGSFPDKVQMAQTNISNCARKVTTRYKPFITFMRVFFTILWAVLFFALCINVFMGRKHRQRENPMMLKLQTVGNTALILLTFFQVLFWATDFYGTYRTVPTWVSFMFECTIYPLVLIILSSVLGHWVEVYSSAVETLKKEQMLQKINSMYAKDITIDDVVARVQFLKKYKWPFVVIIIIGFMVNVAYLVMRSTHNFASGNAMTYAWTAYYTLCWFLYSFGFIIYGYRLVRLLPPEVGGRMKQLSRTITITTLSLVALWSIALGINAPFYYTTYGLEIYIFVRAFFVNIMIVFLIYVLSTVFLRYEYLRAFLRHPLASMTSSSWIDDKDPKLQSDQPTDIADEEVEEIEFGMAD